MTSPEPQDAAEWPYYIDDPLVDRAAHRLELHSDFEGGLGYCFGTCSCGEFTTPTWDEHAVSEAYDRHMGQVQYSAHAAAAEKGSQQ
ncbi:hypothetical protein AB0K18_43185 [Nonomuraea sp. NPDC049421]|uniref:hypothetical protein n=1 Tax=Nonomuraea sp. NPDC049421 TaxID=3155275 RepID=UPI00343C8658